jgi:aspartate/tyrosine/aromatic aminotransferase
LFQHISRLSADSILGLMAKFRADPHPQKVDLGVGVFRDLAGNTPILDCVRRAERDVLAAQTSKAYVGAAGREEFNSSVESLVLGGDHVAHREHRARTVQTPGGCGALRVGAELIRAASSTASVHVSDPTWGNHIALLGSSGFRLQRYPYYDASAHELRFEALLEHLERVPAGDVVLIHGCCHNPTGADLSLPQWETLAQLLERRRLLPFLDIAYQGFGAGLEADAAGVRLVAARVPESLIAVSFSKNLGLYRERVGALISIGENEERANAMLSHVLQIARSIYSMPPDHGAAIAAHIFASAAYTADWIRELDAMRVRMTGMRNLLADQLHRELGDKSFDFIRTQRGMFSLLGVSPAAVERLREEHHIYMLGDSRMNVAGLMPHNAAYVAAAVAKTIGLERAA